MGNGAETLKNVAEQTTVAGAEAFKANAERATAAGNQAFQDGVQKSLGALNEINAQGKRNLEAVVASVTAAARGAEALGAQAMAYTKKSLEDQAEAAKAITAARSVQEMVELQTGFARTAMESYINELNRASETLSAAVKDSFRPLSERATSVVETLQAAR
jgi:phasin family protein